MHQRRQKKKHLSYVISPECDISVCSKSSFEDAEPMPESPTVLQDCLIQYRLTLSLHKALNFNKYSNVVM